MSRQRFLLAILVLIIITGVSFAVRPVRALPAFPVFLDAQSLSAADANPATTNSVVKTFNVGMILEANTTTPLTGLFGWQSTIIYDNTTVAPQGDPSATALYPDGSANTITFGAQTGTGNPNWAGKIAASGAFGGSAIIDLDHTHREIQVFLTIVGGAAVTVGPVSSTAVKGNLLASVPFEIIKPATALTFALDASQTKFVDSLGAGIAMASPVPAVTVGITNSPPVASFTATPLPSGDASCTPVTGAPCSAYALTFDSSASADSDGTIASPAGYFWDWGDGTQDSVNSVATCVLLNCNQGPIAVHDYGTAVSFVVTLRVVDALGATGSSRDPLGTVILNNQPSHTQHQIIADIPPTAAFTFTPANPAPSSPVSFDASTSAPQGAGTTIANYFWNFGDGVQEVDTTATTSHTYSTANTYSVSLKVQDNLLVNSTVVSHSVTVGAASHGTTTSVSCNSPVVVNQVSTCTATVTDTDSSPTTPLGTVSFQATGSASGSFGSTSPCNLSAGGTAGTATCTASFTATAAGTAQVSASYTSSGSSHSDSSSTTAATITVNTRTTSTSITCNTPVTVSTPSSCTATVTDTSPSGPALTPSGSVGFTSTGAAGTFDHNSCTLSPGATGSASCSVNFTPSATGTSSISGSYTPTDTTVHSGSSTTNPASIVVNPPAAHSTTTTVSCDTPVLVNQESICKATVTDTSTSSPTSPAGMVAFTRTGSATGSFGSSSPCQLTPTSASTSSCNANFLPSGSGAASISADYTPSDTTHNGSSSTTSSSITVNPRSTSTSIRCASPVTVNTASLCSAAVTDSSTVGTALTPTGTVGFTETGVAGTFDHNSCALIPGTTGTASCSVNFTPSAAGTANVSGAYTSTDMAHSGSSTTAPATITVGSSPDFSITAGPVSPATQILAGSSGTSTITLAALNGFTGTVNLSVSASSPSGLTCNLPTSAIFGTTPQTALLLCSATLTGDYSVTVTGTSGSLTHDTGAISFHVVDYTIQPSSPITISGNSGASISQTITLTAVNGFTGTVDLSVSASTPSGLTCTLASSVTFGTSPKIASLSCNATVTTTTDFTVTVTGASGSLSHSTAAITFHVAFVANLDPTSTNLSCDTPVVVNQPSTCTATVTDTSGTPTTPSGTISFSSDSSGEFPGSGSCGLSSGSCSIAYTPNTRGSGTHTITASYGGDSTHNTSLGNAAITVNPRSSSTSVACAPPTITTAQSSTCTVTVTDTSVGIPITPTGTFSLTTSNTGSFSGPCSLSAAATCSVDYSPTATGTHTITANYPGDSSHSSSQNTFSITVNAPANVPPIARFTESTTTAPTRTSISFDASASSDPDGSITSYAWDFGDGTTANGVTTTHKYSTTGSFTVTLTVTDNGGLTNQSSATKVITSPSQVRMLLTFSAFDADQFVKGVGELDVRVNGNLVVNIPAGLIHLTGTGSFAPFNERWVFFGPFDITGSIIPGANTITFTNPLDDHASRVRNVTITSNDQLLLSFRGTSSITPDHGLRLIFLSAPLVFASLTVSPSSVVVGEETTFTAAYTGGAGPFTCIFRFGDDTSARVTSQGQSCTAAHTYDNDGLVTVRVTVRDRAGNTVSGKLSIAVNSDEENADPIPLLVTVVKPVGRPYE